MQGISKQEEAELPLFKDHKQAIQYFEEMYGEEFVFEESLQTKDGLCFFYRLITDKEAYIKGVSDLNSTGHLKMDFISSYQPIRIMKDGLVQVGHDQKRT